MPPTDTTIRTATIEDAPHLVDLYRRAYEANARIGFPSSMTSLARATVAEWLETRSVFVGVHGEEIVGSVHLIPRPDWGVPEVGRLVVAPAHQREGVATRLLAFAEAEARSAGHERLRLRAFSGHPFLEDWYRRVGYEHVDVEVLEDRPFDAAVMEREL